MKNRPKEANVKVQVVYDYKHEGSNKLKRCGTVWVRVYESRTCRKYISTGVRVLPREWSDDWMVVGRDDAAQLNNIIRQQVDKCKADVANAINAGGDEMPSTKSMKIDRGEASFLDWMAAKIETQRIATGTKKHHISMYNMLCDYDKIRRFEDVTRKNINKWIGWLHRCETTKIIDGKKVSVKIRQSTVHDHWKRLRKYIHLAQADGLIPMSAIANLTIERGESEKRVFLNDEELKKWQSVELPTEHLRMARDRFLVQAGSGLAFADMIDVDWSLREELNGMVVLNGERVKTGKAYFCVVLPMAVDVLKRWDWKVPEISNVNYNIYLDEVARRAGINKHVTSHVGRHTYACYCLRHGVRIEAVQRTLGHTKITTTQIYARLAGVDVVDAFSNMK